MDVEALGLPSQKPKSLKGLYGGDAVSPNQGIRQSDIRELSTTHEKLPQKAN